MHKIEPIPFGLVEQKFSPDQFTEFPVMTPTTPQSAEEIKTEKKVETMFNSEFKLNTEINSEYKNKE